MPKSWESVFKTEQQTVTFTFPLDLAGWKAKKFLSPSHLLSYSNEILQDCSENRRVPAEYWHFQQEMRAYVEEDGTPIPG